MKMQHTPGPWVLDLETSTHVMTEEGYAISDHPEYSSIRDESEILANAKLIAAAPEMLDALRQMLACCYDLERNDETIAAVKAAMKAVLNATGETK